MKKTESLNLDKNGRKLWRLAKVLNNEDCRGIATTIQANGTMATGKSAANIFVDIFAKVSQILIPPDREQEVTAEAELLRSAATAPEEHMSSSLTMRELEAAIQTLKQRKSPGPDGVTNDMLRRLGPVARRVLLKLMNQSWRRGVVPQVWKESRMVPIPKKGKAKTDPNSYRPISLLSCTAKLMERIVTTRLVWHLEKKGLLIPQQAGFRKHMSTEDKVAHIAQEIEDAFQAGQHTLAVWVDMEKAFDKVWHDGLRLKMLRAGVGGKMFDWISHLLANRAARVQLQGQTSRKARLQHGVPQGGVLSPTLFLIYINDVMGDVRGDVHSSLYANDLALWTSDKLMDGATWAMQCGPRSLESWSNKWLLRINESKTTYTSFTLSATRHVAELLLNGTALREDEHPTYLGITLDKRLTWTAHIDQVRARAKQRLAMMRKLAGTSWGADTKVLKRLYVGRVRPVLEYGASAWSTTSKTNYGKVQRVQNSAARIITGALRSTPINSLESFAGLQPMEDRQAGKVLLQAEKFRRLTGHPMHERFMGTGRCRLQRTNFVALAKGELSKHEVLAKPAAVSLTAKVPTPPWRRTELPELICDIPGITDKQSQTSAERKSIAVKYISDNFPRAQWTHAYTDGSAKNATEDGGGGVYIKFLHRDHAMAVATGKYCNNYQAEAAALGHAATALRENTADASDKVVIFTDAKSVLTALTSQHSNDLSDLTDQL